MAPAAVIFGLDDEQEKKLSIPAVQYTDVIRDDIEPAALY